MGSGYAATGDQKAGSAPAVPSSCPRPSRWPPCRCRALKRSRVGAVRPLSSLAKCCGQPEVSCPKKARFISQNIVKTSLTIRQSGLLRRRRAAARRTRHGRLGAAAHHNACAHGIMSPSWACSWRAVAPAYPAGGCGRTLRAAHLSVLVPRLSPLHLALAQRWTSGSGQRLTRVPSA